MYARRDNNAHQAIQAQGGDGRIDAIDLRLPAGDVKQVKHKNRLAMNINGQCR